MHKAGLNTKLTGSWEEPYTVMRKNSPLSYRIDTGDRIIPSMHIQLLKRFVPRKSEPRISRVTSVFNPDTHSDSLEDRYSEVMVRVVDAQGKQARDIAMWEEDFKDTLTREPGLTYLAKFSIGAGDHPPIFQRAYNTPTSLIESIEAINAIKRPDPFHMSILAELRQWKLAQLQSLVLHSLDMWTNLPQ